MKCNQPCPGFELVSPCPFPTTVTITPRAPPKNATRKATTKHYDWALLNNRDIRDKYALELRNRFEALQEALQEAMENFIDQYHVSLVHPTRQ